MPSVTVIWPDKNYEISISAEESAAEWKFPLIGIPKNVALCMELSPSITSLGHTYSQCMFTKFSVGNSVLDVKYFGRSVYILISEDITISIRKISKTVSILRTFHLKCFQLAIVDLYQEQLNCIPASGVHLNIFLGDDERHFKYMCTINGKVSSIRASCKKFLREVKLEPLDYEISLFGSESQYTSLYRADELSDHYNAVMNVCLKPIPASKKEVLCM